MSRTLPAALHVHRIESCRGCRAFPERAGPRILSLESVDYFVTNDYFYGRKKNNLNDKTSMVWLTGRVLQRSLALGMRFIFGAD